MELADILNLTSNNDPDKAISSYDKSRHGTVLGDGGGLLLLEDLDSAVKRGAKIYCEIIGHSQNSHGDAAKTSLFSPELNGYESYNAARDAMVQAGVTPSEIDLVNGQGDSTIFDITEAKAFRSILLNKKTWDNLSAFEEQNPEEIKESDYDVALAKRAHITAYKGNVSDLQLSSAAIDTIMAIKSIETGILPKIRNLEDPCIGDLQFVMGENIKKEVKTVLKTCYGFGSSAGALVLRKI